MCASWPQAHAVALRGEVERGLLADGQGVNVGAQGESRPGSAGVEDAHHAGTADARMHLVKAQCAQVLGDQRRGARFLEAELGVGMDVAAPVDDALFEVTGGGVQAVMERGGGGLGGGPLQHQDACQCAQQAGQAG